MEQHTNLLKNRCRVCGNKPRGYVHSKLSKACDSLLSTLLAIDVKSESEVIFPPVVCNSCYITLKKAKEERTDITHTPLTIEIWEPHTDLCQLCLKASSSGGQLNRKRKGRPSEDDPSFQRRKIMRMVDGLGSPEFANFPLPRSMFLPSPFLDDLVCQHCQCIPSQPVELATCRHHLCIQCIKSGTIACPCTENSSILADHIGKPSPLTLNIIGSLLVRCADCGEVMELRDLMAHTSSKCEHTTIPCPSKVTVKQLLLDREQGSKQSLMELHNMGLVAEKLVPSNGHVTFRSSSGKVKENHIIIITHAYHHVFLLIVAFNSCKDHHTCSGLCHSI